MGNAFTRTLRYVEYNQGIRRRRIIVWRGTKKVKLSYHRITPPLMDNIHPLPIICEESDDSEFDEPNGLIFLKGKRKMKRRLWRKRMEDDLSALKAVTSTSSSSVESPTEGMASSSPPNIPPILARHAPHYSGTLMVGRSTQPCRLLFQRRMLSDDDSSCSEDV